MVRVRKTESEKQVALNFFIRGLTCTEIEKMTGIPKRTLEGYALREKWTEHRAAKRQTEQVILLRMFQKEINKAQKQRGEVWRIESDREMFNNVIEQWKNKAVIDA